MPRVRRKLKHRSAGYTDAHIRQLLIGYDYLRTAFGRDTVNSRCDHDAMRQAWNDLRDELLFWESFLQGEATVPTNAESLRVDGRDYIYFGPLPALLRLPLNALWPDNFGLWGRIATLGGALLAPKTWNSHGS